MSDRSYDYIITGLGCAGLSLAMYMIDSAQFENKKILLVDRERKNYNDRTWCFWEQQHGLFEPIVFRVWDRVRFFGDDIASVLDISPYSYKMIRGIDFYQFCYEQISKQKNFELLFGNVESVDTTDDGGHVIVNGKKYSGKYLFNSVILNKPEAKNGEYFLLQHFKGRIIETTKPCFEVSAPTLMDFRPQQDEGTTFGYVIPFTETKALVEYTIFSEELLAPEKYDQALKTYIQKFVVDSEYQIVEEEFGIIPMTNHKFQARNGHIINIGTAGGQTKASTGYTFRFIQKHCHSIVASLIKNGHPLEVGSGASKRFRWYDSVLLNLLANRKLEGKYIFTELFKKNKPSLILKFLDNETTIAEEMKLLNTLPKLPFMKAGWEEILK